MKKAFGSTEETSLSATSGLRRMKATSWEMPCFSCCDQRAPRKSATGLLARAARVSMTVAESGLVRSDRKGMRKLKGAATRIVTRWTWGTFSLGTETAWWTQGPRSLLIWSKPTSSRVVPDWPRTRETRVRRTPSKSLAGPQSTAVRVDGWE